jgi:hypothetical protein
MSCNVTLHTAYISLWFSQRTLNLSEMGLNEKVGRYLVVCHGAQQQLFDLVGRSKLLICTFSY